MSLRSLGCSWLVLLERFDRFQRSQDLSVVGVLLQSKLKLTLTFKQPAQTRINQSQILVQFTLRATIAAASQRLVKLFYRLRPIPCLHPGQRKPSQVFGVRGDLLSVLQRK